MLTVIKIEGFKSIEKENLKLSPLTILTGVNSSGKSTVVQALLLLLRFSVMPNRYSMEDVTRPYSNVREVRNRFNNTDVINITLPINNNENIKELGLSVSEEDKGIFRFRGKVTPTEKMLHKISSGDFDMSTPPECYIYEKQEENKINELFYLSANRIGPQDIAPVGSMKVGPNAEFLFGFFDEIKARPLVDELVYFTESNGSTTIGYQVGKWLSKITSTVSELKTERINSSQVKVTFDTDGLEGITASNLGAGMSYVAKIIILCLMAKKGDLIIIENPEIHLHPQAQAQLGVLFGFIAQSGIQIIVETHSEHFINKIRYQIYKNELDKESAIIHYK
ncbi:AAA family ATPase, partial [Photobacterium profundum]|uniref:AAA family ATPase n=1 Tax=Photobacterium profundum TaxID=74109 RepID=UPI003D0E391A